MQITNPQDITQLGTIISVWAHPDDESWCAAGILCAAIANGQKVCCVTATKGEAGNKYEPGMDPTSLASAREQELQTALDVIGITCHHWLGYHDGKCKTEDSTEAVARLIKLIEHAQPDTVLTFGPDGMTGHDDHRTVSRWTSLALTQARLTKPVKLYHKVESKEWYERIGKAFDAQFDVYFNIDQPPLVAEADMDLCFKLDDKLCQQKLEALRVQKTQTAALFATVTLEVLQDTFSCEGFRLAEEFEP